MNTRTLEEFESLPFSPLIEQGWRVAGPSGDWRPQSTPDCQMPETTGSERPFTKQTLDCTGLPPLLPMSVLHSVLHPEGSTLFLQCHQWM